MNINKRLWRIWGLTYWHRWILVRRTTGQVMKFKSKHEAEKYHKEGGFGHMAHLVLRDGERPRKGHL